MMMDKQKEIIRQMSSVLFWDVDMEQVELDKQAGFFIQRVLEYGDLHDWSLILSYFGLDVIVAECKKMRTLDPVCLSYISAISHTRKEDYRCYHIVQSNPTPWNS